MTARGFTLFELLITLTIVTILMAVGVPSFSSQIHENRLKTATLSLLESVELTRSQAVFSHKRATLRQIAKWEDGWEVFIDDNNNGILDANERLVQSREKISGIRITPNQPLKKYVSFISTGESRFVGTADSGAFQAGTFKICPIKKGEGYSLILAPGGRMRMDKINAEECDETK